MLIVITRATAKKISQCRANQTEIGYFLYIFSQPVAWFALSLSSLCFPSSAAAKLEASQSWGYGGRETLFILLYAYVR